MAEEKQIGMTVADLIATLSELPPDLPVMQSAEGTSLGPVGSAYVTNVVRAAHDWSGTVVGQYRFPDLVEGEPLDGEPFQAVIIDLENKSDFPFTGPETAG